jgi:Tfp pilus assembly protein PilP
MRIFIITSVLISAMLLTSCQTQKKDTARQDVARYIASVEKAAETDQSTALLKQTVIHPVVYNSENLRDPFELPTMVKNTKNYPNAILKDVSLNSLKLVGIVTEKNQRWAMFKTSEGQLYKITEGMRAGFQQALLTKIDLDSVTFTIDANTEVGEKPRDVVFTTQENK